MVNFKRYKGNMSRDIRIISKHLMRQISQDYVVNSLRGEAFIGNSPIREGSRRADLAKRLNYEDARPVQRKMDLLRPAFQITNSFSKSYLSRVIIMRYNF